PSYPPCIKISAVDAYSSLPSLLARALAIAHTYTLSLHDALPISIESGRKYTRDRPLMDTDDTLVPRATDELDALNQGNVMGRVRSEEHTSEFQSQSNLVCRLLLEKKKHGPLFARGGPDHLPLVCP